MTSFHPHHSPVMGYYDSPFIDEETSTERVNTVTKITQLIRSADGIESKAMDL